MSKSSLTRNSVANVISRRHFRLLFVLRGIEVVIAVAALGIAIETEVPLDRFPIWINTGLAGPVIPILAMFSSTAMDCESAINLWIVISVCSFLCYVLSAVSTYAEMPTIEKNQAKQFYGQWIKIGVSVFLILLLAADCVYTVYLKFNIYMANFKNDVIEEMDRRLVKKRPTK